jgi:CheY-like chemotaxis protein
MILVREGYRVVGAETAELGLSLAQKELPSLIIMDLKLPGMDGLEATRILKADPMMSHIPILMLTAYAMQADKVRAFDAGCAEFVTKPIDLKSFVNTVRRLAG